MFFDEFNQKFIKLWDKTRRDPALTKKDELDIAVELGNTLLSVYKIEREANHFDLILLIGDSQPDRDETISHFLLRCGIPEQLHIFTNPRALQPRGCLYIVKNRTYVCLKEKKG